MKLFDTINTLDNRKKEYWDYIIKKIKEHSYVYLRWISESCDEAIYFFNKNKIIIKWIFELQPENYDYKYKWIDLIKQSYNNIDNQWAIVITCSYYETIKNQLKFNYKDIENRLFMFDWYFLEDKTINYYIENKETILNCYNSLEDEKSKEIYNALLEYRYIRNPELISKLYESRNNCYLDKVFIDNFKDWLYIDAGSYNADFITTLANRVDISKSEFYIFEPNKIFYNQIKENLDKWINYEIFNNALCDKDSTMEFMQIQSSTSHIIDEKYNAYKNSIDKKFIDTIQTNKLDTIIKDKSVKWIKVDIEGSEYSMIQGAKETITKNRPTILLSIYHRRDDLFKLQEYLIKLNLDYKFYVRHYSLSVAKTILYCIPK